MNINSCQISNMHSGKDIVVNDWAKILDNRGQVNTFILDFEKAFDTPPHELLKKQIVLAMESVARH